MSWQARLRRWWWQRVRRYEYEICDKCGKPVDLVWWCNDDLLWEAVTGREKRAGKEPADGTWCVHCFDKAAQKLCPWVEWTILNQRHLLHPSIEGTVAKERYERNRRLRSGSWWSGGGAN